LLSHKKGVWLSFRMVQHLSVFRGAERGVTLVETLVALALMGIIAAAFLGGLATVSKATFIVDEQAMAENLARSQMESVKSQSYISYANPDHGNYGLITAPDGYSVEITVVPVDPNTGQPLPSGQDNGMQKITAIVKHQGKQVITFESYKVNR